MAATLLLYQRIAERIEQQIKTEVLKTGDKLPSLRTVCDEHGVSMNTALQAYFTLEKKGLIRSRPQSGYYVSFAPHHFPAAASASSPLLTHGVEEIEDIIARVAANRRKGNLLFSSGTPALELLPVAKLNKAMVHVMRYLPDSGIGYNHAGSENLKRIIAKRSATWGGKLKEKDIVTTAGCMDALAYTMMSIVKSGDTIAVESPVYFGILQLARSLGLKVIELPTDPVSGIEIEALKKLLVKGKIKLCLLVSNFSNPVGSCMPDEHKKEVVRLMELYDVPLIEDDIYGDLYLGSQRPQTCKTFDESGNVLLCSSFSKTLAPGYRVGWIAPGKFKDKIDRTKMYHAVSNNVLAHEAVAWFLENDRYDNHLRKLRQALHANLLQYLRCITAYFPEGTKVSRPQGGYILWIQLPKGCDVLALYDKAIRHKLSIGPGPMYTLQRQYGNCFRLSYGLLWTEKVEVGLKLLGKLARELS